jgi:AhpD family alkylhydroperoxidase
MVERTWRRLPRTLADLATLRAASVIGCPWCLDFGTLVARHSGVTEQQLAELHRWESSAAFDATQRRVLAYADAMTTTPMTVTDEQVAALRDELGEAGVVELTALIALENHRSRFNHALGITAQGFSQGACALPSEIGAAPHVAQAQSG